MEQAHTLRVARIIGALKAAGQLEAGTVGAGPGNGLAGAFYLKWNKTGH